MSAILNSSVPAWVCIPFVGLLLCIAVMPLLAGEWWENHQPLVVGIWVGIDAEEYYDIKAVNKE